MKKLSATLLTMFMLGMALAQSTAEERFDVLKENYEIVMEKLAAGTLTLDDENYYQCRRMFRKINSYDKATTMKLDEFKAIKKSFDGIKGTLQMGTVYLSNSPDGTGSSTSFVAGEPMFVVIKCGQTQVKESLRPHPDDFSQKVLTIYFEQTALEGVGIVHIPVPEDQWGDNQLVTDITLDGSQPEFNDVYVYLGQLPKGSYPVTVTLPRGEFASSISKALPRVEINIDLSINDNKLAEISKRARENAYQAITLGTPAISDTNLESELKSIYKKAYPNHELLRLVINEDWYDLKDGNYLSYKKLNAYLAVKKEDGNCYRVYVGYVKENLADVGVNLGPIKILNTGVPLNYTKMPCANVNK